MYSETDIIECFDSSTWDYLKNKNTGGKNAQKGVRYEDIFAVAKLAALAQTVIETGSLIHIYSQVLAFVDDLIIAPENGVREHYQLKNVQAIAWGTGKKSIADDFQRQKQLNDYLSIECRLFLVVSGKPLQTQLTTDLPSNLRDFTEVSYFLYDLSIVKLIKQDPEFKASLSYLSSFEQPAPDKLESLAAFLLSIWLTCPDTSVRGILTRLRQDRPVYIRIFDRDIQIDSQVNLILGQIPDFKFGFAKGVFEWDYLDGLETGHLPYSVDSEYFGRFESRVKTYKPTTFDDLEQLL